MRYAICIGFLSLVCVMMTSCSWMIDGDALGAALAPGILPGLVLSSAAHDFRDAEGRWPATAEELEGYAKPPPEFEPSNFSVVGLTPTENDSLAITYAIDAEEHPHLPEEWTIVVNSTD